MNFGNIERKDLRFRFCGSGGMGIILIGYIFGKAAIYDDKNALQTQSYGATQRGSKVRSDIIISEDQILNPIIDKADVLIALSQNAFDYYLPNTTEDYLLLINSNLIDYANEKSTIKIPASNIAHELKNLKVLNTIMLGALIKKTQIISKKSIIKAITDSISKTYRDINIQAFNRGYNFL